MERPLPRRTEGARLSDRIPRALLLSGGDRRALGRQARDAAPAEACGLLLGEVRPEGVRVDRVLDAANLAPGEGRFLVDPAAQLRAEGLAARLGLQLIGAWHSHPNGPCVLSRADLAGAGAYPVALIVGSGPPGAAGPRLAAWWVEEGRQHRLRIEESSRAPFSAASGQPKG